MSLQWVRVHILCKSALNITMDLKGLGVDFDLAEVGCQGKFVPVPKRKNNEGFPRKTVSLTGSHNCHPHRY